MGLSWVSVLWAVLASAGSLGGAGTDTDVPAVDWDLEYRNLEKTVKDRVGLEAIRALHQQLDDDHDGTIEPSETKDFVRVDLQLGSSPDPLLQHPEGDGSRHKLFHKKDAEITVTDLWDTWAKSEVHNWTVTQTVDWLRDSVDLPQYASIFIEQEVTGNQLPRAASDPTYLSKTLGITNTIHRSKISLKAMDVVLFGPPKEPSHWMKDLILTSLLVALLSALLWAYRTKKLSEEHISKMNRDMESLAKAEQALQDMQSRVNTGEEVKERKHMEEQQGNEEVAILKEEVEILKEELQRAEVELEDKCWVAPTLLQHWLQLTHELESQVYNAKRISAEGQIEMAKDACEKLKRKRSSLVGAFVSTHGRSIEDVDKSIMEAKSAMMELTQDLAERSQRWRQIEMLTGVSIVTNPGLAVLRKLVRHVGAGNRGIRGSGGLPLSSRMSSMDDLGDDSETRSLAPSLAASHTSHVSGSLVSSVSRQGGQRRRAVIQPTLSRESSKESSQSESDELMGGGEASGGGRERPRVSVGSMDNKEQTCGFIETRSVAGAGSRSLAGDSTESRAGDRRGRMVKSLSQDTGCSLPSTQVTLSSSTSDSALHSKVAMAPSILSLSPCLKGSPSQPALSEVEESCSDTGSCSDLSGQVKKKKSFFNFRKKKDKVTAS